MEKSKKPTPEDFGWVAPNGLGDDDHGWMYEGGEEEYYEALSRWNDEKIQELFDEKGMCREKERYYFDKNRDLIDWIPIMSNYMKYPADSDIVKLFYAEKYADETHGNYDAQTLFFRAL